MSIKALQEYTYISKYARYIPGKNRRETWKESVTRVRDMHLRKYPQIEEEINWAFDKVENKLVLGSQRALQFGGKPIEKVNERIYNCSSAYVNRLRFFQEALFLLLAGCGVGLSVQKHHVAKLPEFSGTRNGKKVFLVPDSIQGWADALGVLLSSYFEDPVFPEYYRSNIEFDFSSVRPEGSYLSSGIGKAPGHVPLKNSLNKIKLLLDRCVYEGRKKLRPIDAYDLVMHSSDAVLSGGIRRSATITLFSLDDEDMLTSKTGNWFYENPQRGRSNNSALLLRNETSFEDFSNIMSSVKEYGEPGAIWSDSTETLFNPCVEIALYGYDESGESGFQFCNLSEQNGAKIKNKDDFKTSATAAAIIGTCQAGYTDFPYLTKASENITRKEALLGVSMTGIMENPDLLLDPDVQKEIATLVLETNEKIAKKIGINPCARGTCVKPAGTSSLLLGTSSGIHPHRSPNYLRRSQGNSLESPLQYFKKYNPLAVERSVWSANNTDEIVTFCISVNNNAKTKRDFSALDLLKCVKSTQKHWVEYGTRYENCVQPWLRHNVSNTISVQENEWECVTKYIYENRNWFAGISLIPQSGDKDYQQAPMVEIHSPVEIAQMYGDGAPMASGLIVDGLRIFNGNLWEACDAALGLGNPLIAPTLPDVGVGKSEWNKWAKEHKIWFDKVDWIRRAKQYSERYFKNDVRKMTYCLKDVHNWKLWCDLNRECVDVDYSVMTEDSDNTELVQEIACAGGACSVGYA